jgi:formylglycine-generating enzyme required for sulfatase activity
MVTVFALCLVMILTACPNPSGGDGGGGSGGGGGGDPPVSITETAEGVNYTLRLVPAGTVNVDVDYNGATAGNGDGPFSNAATSNVPVSAFYIGETEVTYELWKAVYDWATDAARGPNVYTIASSGRQGGDGSTGPVGTNQHPVTEISWRDVVVWCNAYSEATGRTPVYKFSGNVLRTSANNNADTSTEDPGANGYRLPTSAQWEYAARGGVPSTNTPWTYTYAGSGTVGDVAVYNTTKTATVKSKAANSRGLYDMSGNVWEWCQDLYSGVIRVVRGGGWSVDASYCAVAFWDGDNPNIRNPRLGFRVVCP